MVRLLLLTFILISCVGTVEEKNPSSVVNAETSVDAIIYSGIERVKAVSHNKIEVYFYPAPGGEQDINYLVSVNGGNPIELNPSSLSLNTEGLYTFVLKDLQGSLGAAYNISVGIKNKTTGIASNINKSLTAYTFTNYVANFNGILTVSPREGILGQTEVIVSWVPANIEGVSILPNAKDPIAYQVCYVKVEDGTSVALSEGVIGTCKQLPLATNLPTNPASLNVSYESSRVISGLEPDTDYYFMVRSIHKNYIVNALNPLYRVEENNKVLRTKTKLAGDPVFWDSIYAQETPYGESGRTEKKITWNRATGSFHSYKIYYREVRDSVGVIPVDDVFAQLYAGTNSPITNTNINNFNNFPTTPATPEGDTGDPTHMKVLSVSAEDQSALLTGLTEYSWYTYIVVACETAACDNTERIVPLEDDMFRAIPYLAPFNGVTSIKDPTQVSKINSINLSFDPATVTKGYLNSMKVFCYHADGSTKVEITGTPISDGSQCDGLQLNTTLPVLFSGTNSYEDFAELEIENTSANGWFDPGANFSAENYCFSIIPQISDARASDLNTEAENNIIKKCKNIYKRVPTIDEFPGAEISCNTTIDSMDVRFSTPTEGIFSNFEVFWREIIPGAATVFKFSEAISCSAGGACPSGYGFQDGISGAATNHLVSGLDTGKTYAFGVLSYYSSGVKNYSETNANIVTCKLEAPEPVFREWVNAFAVGPKEDSRRDRFLNPLAGDFRYQRPTILETIDDHGRPKEVEVVNYYGASGVPTPDYSPVDPDLSSNPSSVNPNDFDGIFGKVLNEFDISFDSSTHPLNQYSNSGMVRIVWKDIKFSNGNDMQYYTDLETPALDKNLRKYGYKIYRSDDNGLSWAELTKKLSADGTGHANQLNDGLVHPRLYKDLLRVNLAATRETDATLPLSGGEFYAGVFVDYSVEALPDNGLTARAREYLYKIVPVFNGEELNYQRESSNPQHIIKVTLPPRNMGLVHRLIANRDSCRELGKDYTKLVEKNYTCLYNGLGAKWSQTDRTLGASVYDLGGDLLIDRFEMGCDYSRGSSDPLKSTSSINLENFKGKSDSSQNFEGCHFDQRHPTYDGSGYSISGFSGTYDPDMKEVGTRVGDCLFSGSRTLRSPKYTCPAGTTDTYSDLYFGHVPFPGGEDYGIGGNIPAGPFDCNSPEILVDDFFDPYVDPASKTINVNKEIVQSEPFAVGFHRDISHSSRSYGPDKYVGYRGRGGSTSNGSRLKARYDNSEHLHATSCMINIPVQDDTQSGVQRARWFAVGELDSLQYLEDTDNDNIANTSAYYNILSRTIGELTDRSTFDGLYDFADGSLNAMPDALRGTVVKDSTRGRFDSNTPLSRVVSSNGAKLPPLSNVGNSEAETICESYEVQTGTYSEGTFAETSEVLEKTMMNRFEGILSSRFPTNLSQVDTDSEIHDLENTNAPGACNTVNKDLIKVQSGTVNGAKISISLAASGGDSGRLITGSSELDAMEIAGTSTENCVSKFGISDLIGNVSEITPEVFHCNYSQDMYIRPNGAGDLVQAARIYPGEGVPVNYDSRLDIYVPPNLDLGKCSTVETGVVRNPAQFKVTPNIKPVFDIFGNFDTSIITNSSGNVREDNYLDLRNGDGFFLDFSDNSIAPRLEFNNDISMTANIAEIKYFNPVLGLPLTCNNGSCDNDATDNKNITTAALKTKHGITITSSVDDFYVGAAAHSNVGIAEYSDGVGNPLMTLTNGALPNGAILQQWDYIFGIAHDPLNPGPSNNSVLSYETLFGAGREETTYTSVDLNNYKAANPDHIVPENSDGGTVLSAAWAIYRGATLGFGNFGSHTEAGSRYNLTFRNGNLEEDAQSGELRGFRCVVKINKN